MAVIIQVRQATAAKAAEENVLLAIGEWGYETDTFKLKIGRGLNWNETPYLETEKFKGTYVNGAKKAGEFWATALGIWKVKQDFNSEVGPTANNAYWELILSKTTSASDLNSGTLNDALLSTSVPLKNASNEFTAVQKFTGLFSFSYAIVVGLASGVTRWAIEATGRMGWKSPDGTSLWASLYAPSAGVLETEGKFNAADGLQEGSVNLEDKYALIGSVSGGGTAVQRTGLSLLFDTQAGAYYGSPTSPETGPEVTLAVSGNVKGNPVTVFHQAATEPTWPAGFKIHSGNYLPGVVNMIVATYYSDSYIIVTITQL